MKQETMFNNLESLSQDIYHVKSFFQNDLQRQIDDGSKTLKEIQKEFREVEESLMRIKTNTRWIDSNASLIISYLKENNETLRSKQTGN
jgi:predicted  nucleic acid-binding Zn-ribbon protein